MIFDKTFCAFDGEGIQGKYALLQYVTNFGRTTDRLEATGKNIDYMDAIRFLSSHRFRSTINVWFAFAYDINMIFVDAPEKIQRELFFNGHTEIGDYKIKYIPRKIFSIRMKGKHTVRHFDTWGFFQSNFINALEAWKIPVPPIITQGKRGREMFTWGQLRFIREYNQLECELLISLLHHLREKLIQVNLVPSSWHGAGAISSAMLGRMNARNYMGVAPEDVRLVRRCAYFGGRIELLKRGKYGPVYSVDLNSGYPSAARFLPDLTNAVWRTRALCKPDDFGFVKVKYHLPHGPYPEDHTMIGPFPYRLPNNAIIYPAKGYVWVHNVEYQAACRLYGAKNFRVLECLILARPYNFPFMDQITSWMKQRLEYKHEGDGAHIPLKFGANGFYGKFAQRPTQGSPHPFYRELIYAGFITAHCRAQLLDAINGVDPVNVLAFATDSVKALEPLHVHEGEELGEWECEKWDSVRYLLAGVYSYVMNGVTHDKSRSYGRLDFDKAYRSNMRGRPYRTTDSTFVGIRRALAFPKAYGPHIGMFYDVSKLLDWDLNRKRRFGGRNDLSLPEVNGSDEISKPYTDKYKPVFESEKRLEVKLDHGM